MPNTETQQHNFVKASTWLMITIIIFLCFGTSAAVAQKDTEPKECYQLVFEAWTSSWEDIFVYNFSSGQIINLTHSDENWDVNPSWSPDGNQIVFDTVFNASIGHTTAVTVINDDGSNPKVISKGGAGSSWSQDLNQVFFSLGSDRLTISPDNGTIRKLPAYNPVLLPDGRIGFSSFDWNTQQTTVFLANQDGTHKTTLTSYPEQCELDWSRDRVKIVYCYRNKLITVDTTTGQEQLLLTHLDRNYLSIRTPAWSPDGRFIVYSYLQVDEDIEGVLNLHIINIENGEDRLLVELEGKDLFYPAWSPDGKKIAFLSHNTSEIYLVDSDGSNLQYVANSSSNRGQTFKWRPQCP